MANQPTCGQGLASQADLPRQVAATMNAFAAVLEFHMTALDTQDEAAQQEHDVYRRLAGRCRRAATDLEAAATQMVDARDLPMAPHDPQTMQSAQAVQVFEDFIEAEIGLLRFLERQAAEHEAMLHAMRTSGREPT